MRTASLCSGYGGLELAVEAIWPDAEVTWHAEIDPDAAKVFAAHWPHSPNRGDIAAVDWSTVEPVDVVTSGYPCQPFSTAGRRQGENDERYIWPGVLRAIRHLRPRLVLLENVAGHLSLGFGRVLGDLAEARYDARWTCLPASAVGAPHQRKRVFIVASDADSEGRQGWSGPQATDEWPGSTGSIAADPDRRGCGGVEERDCWPDQPGLPTSSGADVAGLGLAPYGQFQPHFDRWARIIGRPAPWPPLVKGPEGGDQVNAALSEWLMGLPEGWVTDHLPNRPALRVLGNGVVPQQAEAAYRLLIPDAGRVAA